MNRPGVFLSHSHEDKKFVKRLARDLSLYGARVWIDEAEISVGDSLIEKIRNGIDEMDYVAVILSPASVSSTWVTREVDVAMNQEIQGRTVKVLPIVYRRCELPGFLLGKLYADFTHEKHYKPSLNQLLLSIGLDTKDVKFQVGFLALNGCPSEVIIRQLEGQFPHELIQHTIDKHYPEKK